MYMFIPRAVQVSTGRGVNLARPRVNGPTAWPGGIEIIPQTKTPLALKQLTTYIVPPHVFVEVPLICTVRTSFMFIFRHLPRDIREHHGEQQREGRIWVFMARGYQHPVDAEDPADSGHRGDLLRSVHSGERPFVKRPPLNQSTALRYEQCCAHTHLHVGMHVCM